MLASSTVGEGDSPTGPGGILFDTVVAGSATERSVQPRAGRPVRLASEIELQPVGPGSALDLEIVQPGVLLEPQIWATTVDLPATGGKPARLLLREFERYYTDRTVPVKDGNNTRRRRVIEERLVFAVLFHLKVDGLTA